MTVASPTRVTLLDHFGLWMGDDTPVPVRNLPRAGQRLVACLSLSRCSDRNAIAGQLWPDVPEEHAHGSLRSALWRLRRVAPHLVEVSGGSLSLAEGVSVDVHELDAWASRVLDPLVDGEDLAEPGDALRGELLPGWCEEWVLLERERLRQLRMHALEALADKLITAGRLGEAMRAAYAAVHEEPLRESALRVVVRIHLAEGNVVEARRAYESFRDMLADTLGVAPTPHLTGLITPVGHGRDAEAAPVSGIGPLGGWPLSTRTEPPRSVHEPALRHAPLLTAPRRATRPS